MSYSELLKNSDIPEYMRGGLERYLEDGIRPGSFLCAVLENNLRESVSCADHENRRILPKYVEFLYVHAPSNSWGSPEKVEKFIEQKRKELNAKI